MKDLIKLAIALMAYGGLGPMLGIWLSSRRGWQRGVFALMLIMTALRPGNFMMMIGSVETYRGHTKGYEISLIEVLAIALIVAIKNGSAILPRRGVPGLWLYLGWCSVSLMSALSSFDPGYSLMAATRFTKGALIYSAAALHLRDDEDARWAIGGLAGALFHHGLLCLKIRLFDGVWQVKGWFEHQNPMAMWCYLGALPVLALILRKEVKGALLLVCLGGYAGAGLCILLSVSRAALAAYAVGSAVVLGLAWLRGGGPRVVGFTVLGAVGAVLVSLFALDSFKARLNEVASTSQEVEEDLRDILNRQSAAMLHDHPVSGVGWNNFGIANSRPVGAVYSEILEEWDRDRGFTIYDENYYQNPLTESLYWLWLAETGYPGFLAFILFCAATAWWALRSTLYFGSSLLGSVAGAIAVGLIICYGHGLVERILTQTKNLSQWLMFAGMAAGMEVTRRSQARLAKTSGAQGH